MQNVASLFSAVTPWKTASLAGVQGHLVDEHETPALLINYEWPLPALELGERMTKRQKERLHLERYATDHLIATGRLPYSRIEEGADPPDFILRTAEAETRLDCAQFAVPGRRTAHGLFERIRRAIVREDRERFTQLRGLVVYMWFDDAGEVGFPPKGTDDRHVSEIIDALSQYHFDPASITLPTPELPPEAPKPNLTKIGRCTFYAFPMQDGVPATAFFTRTSFELGMVLTTIHTASDIEAELQRVIDKHDRGQTDQLLITVGGPNESGFVYPSEQREIVFALDVGISIRPAQSVSNATMHIWSTGAIVQLLPEVKILAGDLYPTGLVPTAHCAVSQSFSVSAASSIGPGTILTPN